MGIINAAAMAEAKAPPEIVLPRFRWVPFIGRFLARVLPVKTVRGYVLSNDEFTPFQVEWIDTWADASKGELSQRDVRRTVVKFLKAQGLPHRDILALPGGVLQEVLESLFLFQTRTNSPRQIVKAMEKELMGSNHLKTGPHSPTRGRKRRTRKASKPTHF